ncbi:MAG: hypothetical protein Q7S61_00110 [bacterium]|nr:hypothetical protein [bacterium]
MSESLNADFSKISNEAVVILTEEDIRLQRQLFGYADSLLRQGFIDILIGQEEKDEERILLGIRARKRAETILAKKGLIVDAYPGMVQYFNDKRHILPQAHALEWQGSGGLVRGPLVEIMTACFITKQGNPVRPALVRLIK